MAGVPLSPNSLGGVHRCRRRQPAALQTIGGAATDASTGGHGMAAPMLHASTTTNICRGHRCCNRRVILLEPVAGKATTTLIFCWNQHRCCNRRVTLLEPVAGKATTALTFCWNQMTVDSFCWHHHYFLLESVAKEAATSLTFCWNQTMVTRFCWHRHFVLLEPVTIFCYNPATAMF